MTTLPTPTYHKTVTPLQPTPKPHSLIPVALIAPISRDVDSLQRVQLLGDLLDPPAVDQLVQVKGGTAVGALRSLLSKPPSDAHVTAQLRAVRAEVSVAQLFHAYKAAEDLGEGLEVMAVRDG